MDFYRRNDNNAVLLPADGDRGIDSDAYEAENEVLDITVTHNAICEIDVRVLPPSLWSHFENLGPRTTNIAEGWHNSLNSRFGMPHPSLRVFLDWLQKYEYEIQSRLLQLAAGKTPTHRAAVYVRNDEALWSAKVAYGIAIGHVFMTMGQNMALWDDFYACSLNYLNRASYLLGCK